MNNFLEVDDYLYKYENSDIIYKNHNIYLIHFPKGLKSKISFGKIQNISVIITILNIYLSQMKALQDVLY